MYHEDEHGREVREEMMANFKRVHDFTVYHSEMKLRARRQGGKIAPGEFIARWAQRIYMHLCKEVFKGK